MKIKEINNRQETIYNKIVNIAEDGEITILESIFEYTDGFKGATGSKFYPVSKKQFEEETTREAIIDYLIDSGIKLPEDYKRGGFQSLADSIIYAGEEGDLIYDQSHSELWDYFREELKLTENEAYIFTCTCGGRCFDKNFKGTHNKELHKLIIQAEA